MSTGAIVSMPTKPNNGQYAPPVSPECPSQGPHTRARVFGSHEYPESHKSHGSPESPESPECPVRMKVDTLEDVIRYSIPKVKADITKPCFCLLKESRHWNPSKGR